MRSFSTNADASSLIFCCLHKQCPNLYKIRIVTSSFVSRLLPLIVTSSFSPSRETLAPGFSATNLAGSIVLLLTICGAESFVFEVPKTSASFSPRFIVGLTDAGREFIMTLLIEVKTAEWQIFN